MLSQYNAHYEFEVTLLIRPAMSIPLNSSKLSDGGSIHVCRH